MGNDQSELEGIKLKQDEMKEVVHKLIPKCKDESSGAYSVPTILKLLKLLMDCKVDTLYSEKMKKKEKPVVYNLKVAQAACDEFTVRFDDGSFKVSFEVFDVNKDGKLTFKELYGVTKLVTLLLFQKLNKKGLKLFFETMDYDNNGYLDFEEYKLFTLSAHIYVACQNYSKKHKEKEEEELLVEVGKELAEELLKKK